MYAREKDGGNYLNLPGSYNCSCSNGYEGDGYSSEQKISFTILIFITNVEA